MIAIATMHPRLAELCMISIELVPETMPTTLLAMLRTGARPPPTVLRTALGIVAAGLSSARGPAVGLRSETYCTMLWARALAWAASVGDEIRIRPAARLRPADWTCPEEAGEVSAKLQVCSWRGSSQSAAGHSSWPLLYFRQSSGSPFTRQAVDRTHWPTSLASVTVVAEVEQWRVKWDVMLCL